MKALRCPHCRRLTAEGDYGNLITSVIARHRNKPDQEDDRFADVAHDEDLPDIICKGSGATGSVEKIPDWDDGFAPWNEV